MRLVAHEPFASIEVEISDYRNHFL
ncbi:MULTISPECIES: hypothetical protein [Clostridium]|nr:MULTISPECIES: hypothetical protein [Clostridium]MDU3520942.1 hypothetical protein [Clostridium saudiense]MEE0726736.1 hypothetical protein [Clostridium saudiense]